MHSLKKITPLKPSLFSIVFLLIISIIILSGFYIDRVAAFAVNHFTDYHLTYKKWGRSIFDRREITGVYLGYRNGWFGINVERVFLNFRILPLLKKGQFILNCEMKEVSFNSGTDSVLLDASDNILSVLFKPGREYSDIGFTGFIDRNVFKVLNFKADSKDIKVKGDYTFFKKKNEVLLDVSVSFSPEIVDIFKDDFIKENMLSIDADGWYSTVIEYRGNPEFLKALYTFAIPS